MKPFSVVTLSVLLLATASREAFAEESGTLLSTVQRELLAPMAKRDQERSIFSRARMPVMERTARMVDGGPRRDARGLQFQAFQVDGRSGGGKTSVVMDGCIYPADGAIFVKRGPVFQAAAALLGKQVEAAPEGVCRAVTVAMNP